MSVIMKGPWCFIMYRDKRIIVEAYLDRLETEILLYVDVLSFHLH